MKDVSKALAEKKLSIRSLPEHLQQEIASLKALIIKYNEACDEYEEHEGIDEATEKELDNMEDYIKESEEDLVSKIMEINPVASTATTAAVDGKKKEEDTSIGWLIFGGVVLVATVGLVNVFKKKA